MKRERSVELRGSAGVVIMEVAVAVLLASVAVAGLASATQRAVLAAREVRDDAAGAAVAAWEGARSEEWGWGPMVRSAEWSPGPSLELRFYIPAEESGAVGVWGDGWLVGEWAAGDDSSIEIGQEVWSGRTGEAVNIRVRRDGGDWGPPWRTVVPDAYAQVSATAVGSPPVIMPQESVETPRVAVHVPFVARPRIVSTWSTEPLQQALAGLVYLPCPPLGVTVGVTLDGRTQWWKSDGGRVLDVYF